MLQLPEILPAFQAVLVRGRGQGQQVSFTIMIVQHCRLQEATGNLQRSGQFFFWPRAYMIVMLSRSPSVEGLHQTYYCQTGILITNLPCVALHISLVLCFQGHPHYRDHLRQTRPIGEDDGESDVRHDLLRQGARPDLRPGQLQIRIPRQRLRGDDQNRERRTKPFFFLVLNA